MIQHFGIGFAAAIPSGANPTPIPFAILEDLAFEFSADFKKLRGQYRFPVAVGHGDDELTVKIRHANFLGGAIGQIMGVTPVAGSAIPNIGETATIPTTPFQITVAQGATFREDYRVLDLTTGLFMTRGATATGTGVYAVNTTTGQYTFAAADVGHKVSFVYTNTAASTGLTVPVTNQLKSLASGVVLVGFAPNTNGKPLGLRLYNAFIPKLAVAMKPSDFAMQDLEAFAAQDAASTSVVDVWTGE